MFGHFAQARATLTPVAVWILRRRIHYVHMVFGLNSAAKKARAEALVDTKLDSSQAIEPKLLAKSATKLKMDGSPTPTTITDESGNLFATSKTKRKGMMKNALWCLTDETGAAACVGAASIRMTSLTCQVSKGDAAFSTIKVSKGLMSASATYTVDGTEVYKATKFSTLYFFMTVTTPDGALVARVSQPGMDARKIDIEVGAGVDILAVIMLTNAISNLSGAGAGGLAGAGVY